MTASKQVLNVMREQTRKEVPARHASRDLTSDLPYPVLQYQGLSQVFDSKMERMLSFVLYGPQALPCSQLSGVSSLAVENIQDEKPPSAQNAE